MNQHLRSIIEEIINERSRQVYECRYNHEHDDTHINDEIAALACYYAMPPAARDWNAMSTGYGDTLGEAILPCGWSAQPHVDRRVELIKAAALVLAEIERIDRNEDIQK